MSHSLLESNEVSPGELTVLGEAIARLPVDSPLAKALDSARTSLRGGQAVVVGASDGEVSPADAAKYLGISRPTVYKLIDSGDLPSRKVGSHHRIVVRDLAEYEVRRDAARKDLAETFAHVSNTESELTRRLAGIDEETAQRLGL